MLTAEQMQELYRRSALGDHRAAWYIADRAEIRQELEEALRRQAEPGYSMTKAITALIERMK